MRALLLVSTLVLLPLPSPAAAAGQGTVLFDESHGERFQREGQGQLDLSGFASALAEAGAVTASIKGPVTADALSRARGLVISGPFQPFTGEEIAAVLSFVEGGGRLAVTLHIAPPAAGLLKALGVTHSLGVIHEQENLIAGRSLDFFVTTRGDHPVTRGVDRIAVYGTWALKSLTPSVVSLARTGPRALIDLDGDHRAGPSEALGTWDIVLAGALGKGAFVVFGDDAVFQNRFLQGQNRKLAANLARWLSGD